LILTEHIGLTQHAVYQRRFAVIDMSDYRYISNIIPRLPCHCILLDV
jgi:hypothetical protein